MPVMGDPIISAIIGLVWRNLVDVFQCGEPENKTKNGKNMPLRPNLTRTYTKLLILIEFIFY